jgi:hypothetical protein
MNEPVDRLAELLRLAADEPANRPEFYRALLESMVFVIGHASGQGAGKTLLEAGATLSLQHWQRSDGGKVIPFFTSELALQRAIDREVGFLALPARALFEMTCGTALVLNPRSDYGKEFLPSEIDSLLKTGLPTEPDRRVVKTATKVLLGQPKDYPAALVASLTRLLAKHANVKAAYLGLMHDPTVDSKPHLVIGIEADGDPGRAIEEAGAVAGELARRGEPVDFVAVERGQEGLSRYLLEDTKPFYERTWRARLRSMFGAGRA